MRNFKLKIAYEGTNYHGFQMQKGTGLPTIQEVLEEALTTLAKEKIKVISAGRTDAGVHAQGQVVNFYSQTKVPLDKLPLALNSLLPPDISVLKAELVPFDFHAAFQAQGKTYLYLFYNARLRNPFWRQYTYHVPVPLEFMAEMQKAGQAFVGTHNFKGFCSSKTMAQSFVRTISACSIEKKAEIIKLKITGNGFLHNMVRIMAGTLLEVGQGKRSATTITHLLAQGERTLAGMTLPPQGLYLAEVQYGPETNAVEDEEA